jgi:hypothetical protein
MANMLKNWRALSVLAALGAGLLVAQGVMGQTSVPTRTATVMDPFSPTVTTTVTTVATTRPPSRDPLRAPARSPFRP